MSGDVIIHDSAVVAPGAILQAAPDSRIVIGPGACIGMGTVLNASEEGIEVETGAVLGSGVLMIGSGKIGQNACVGSLTTILNASVAAMTIIPAGSLLGDDSRSIRSTVNGQKNSYPSESSPPEPETVQNSSTPDLKETPPESEPLPEIKSESPSTPAEVPTEADVTVTSPESETEVSPESRQVPVVGQVYINQLLLTLFPERNFFKNLDENNQTHGPEEN